MSEPALYQPSALTISGSHIVQILEGISTDIIHIFWDFDNFTSIRSRFVEGALKVLRVNPMDRNEIMRADNVLTVFSERLSEENAAYTHPNIAPVSVVNVTLTRTTESRCGPITSKAILSPWYGGGSVLDYINIHPSVDRVTLILEIGKALRHLHSHDVVHGAIYPSNILIDSDGHVVVTDAGVHTLMAQYMFISFGHLPIPPSAAYQPPEQLCPATDTMVQPTTSMDVYSFATTAWAMFSGKKPFSDLPNVRTTAQIVVEIDLRGHQRLEKPDDMSTSIWVILQRCMALDLALRPTMMEVVAELEDLSL